jgi:hypothetical protein
MAATLLATAVLAAVVPVRRIHGSGPNLLSLRRHWRPIWRIGEGRRVEWVAYAVVNGGGLLLTGGLWTLALRGRRLRRQDRGASP